MTKTEQNALRSFVAALKGGHTLVLLGSRGGEAWLAKGTFDDSIYTLNGLDPEAASTLADLILKKHNATHYRDNDDLRHLLKLLDGFPLALEVVLPNLAHTTPADILAALQAGDVKLDIEESQQQGKDIYEQKTESILRCIDYSHSNLAPEAQQLLLCLAPFTSVFNTGLLEAYTTQLKQQPALANLPLTAGSKCCKKPPTGVCSVLTRIFPASCTCSPHSPTSCARVCKHQSKPASKPPSRQPFVNIMIM